MIIKNNFNSKNVDSLKDYKSIGEEKDILSTYTNENKFIKKNLENKVLQDLTYHDHEDDNNDDEVRDKWDFFR